MAGPSVGQKIKNHFKRNYKLYFAIGLALLLGLTLFLLTAFCPPVAFVVAGTFSFVGLEAIAGLATLSLAAVAGGILTGASIFLSLAANLSHAVKNFFDKRWVAPAFKSSQKQSDLSPVDDNESESSEQILLISNISNMSSLNKEEEQLVKIKEFQGKDEQKATIYRIFRNKNGDVPHDAFTLEMPSFYVTDVSKDRERNNFLFL